MSTSYEVQQRGAPPERASERKRTVHGKAAYDIEAHGVQLKLGRVRAGTVRWQEEAVAVVHDARHGKQIRGASDEQEQDA